MEEADNITISAAVYEGLDFIPNPEQNVFLKVIFESNVQSTSSVALESSSPSFNTQFSWKTNFEDYRRRRMDRTPMKFECYGQEENKPDRFYGRIVCPLPAMGEPTVQDSVAVCRLLGGSNPEGNVPKVRLQIKVTKDSDENGEMENSDVPEEENSEISELSEGESELAESHSGESLQEDDGEIDEEDQEMEQEGLQDEQVVNEIVSSDEYEDNEAGDDGSHASENPYASDVSEEACDEMEPEEDEEGGTYQEIAGINSSTDCVEIQEQPQNEAGGEWLEADDEEDNIYGDLDEEMDDSDKDSNRTIPFDEDMMEFQKEDAPKMSPLPSEPAVTMENLVPPPPEGIVNNKLTEAHITNLQNRKALKEEVRRLSLNHIQDRKPSAKRPLELTPEKDTNETETNKRQKVDSGDVSANVLSKLDLLKAQNGTHEESTIAARLLNISAGADSKMSAIHKVSPMEKIVVKLDEDEGFFQVGTRDPMNNEVFTMSITVLYAKNLDKAVPSEYVISPSQPYTLMYNIFGCEVHTEPFRNLQRPEFVSEGTTTCLHSTPTLLSKYFQKNPYLTIQLIQDKVPVAECRIDVSQFTSIRRKDAISIREDYDFRTDGALVSPGGSSVGMSLQLETASKAPKKGSFSHFSKLSLAEDSSQSSDDSMDLDSMLDHRRKGKYRRDRRKINKLLKYERSDMLYEASMQIEEWKERQKKMFLKQWNQREAALHQHLASDWTEACKSYHETIEKRLKECDTMKELLNKRFEEVQTREKSLVERENRMQEKEAELNGNRQMNGEHALSNNVNDQTHMLQKQITDLQNTVATTDKKLHEQNEEIHTLRRKLLVKDDINLLKREEANLSEKLEAALEQKQYYKTKWLQSLQDLYRAHNEKNTPRTVSEESSREPTDKNSVATNRLKMLLEEKKKLLSDKTGDQTTLNQTIRNVIENLDC